MEMAWLVALSPMRADPLMYPPAKGMFIIVVMMFGAECSFPFQLVSHLAMISTSMYPNNNKSSTIYGMNSWNKSE